MKKLAPILWTNDLSGTISFYENVLGFKGRGNFPNFVSLSKGAVEIMFVEPQQENFTRSELTGSLFFWMQGTDEFWEEVKDKVTVKDSIANREYLVRDFSILDNNGYELVFGEDISNR